MCESFRSGFTIKEFVFKFLYNWTCFFQVILELKFFNSLMPKTHFEVLFAFCLFNAKIPWQLSDRTWHFHSQGTGSVPGWEIKITQAMWHNKKIEWKLFHLWVVFHSAIPWTPCRKIIEPAINRLNLLFICQSVTVYFVFLCSSRLYQNILNILWQHKSVYFLWKGINFIIIDQARGFLNNSSLTVE